MKMEAALRLYLVASVNPKFTWDSQRYTLEPCQRLIILWMIATSVRRETVNVGLQCLATALDRWPCWLSCYLVGNWQTPVASSISLMLKWPAVLPSRSKAAFCCAKPLTSQLGPRGWVAVAQ